MTLMLVLLLGSKLDQITYDLKVIIVESDDEGADGFSWLLIILFDQQMAFVVWINEWQFDQSLIDNSVTNYVILSKTWLFHLN